MNSSAIPSAVPLTPQGAGEDAPVRPDRLMEGNPAPRAWDLYADRSGQFFAGQWEAGPGRWRVAYNAHEEEFCVLLAGEVRLTSARGDTCHFRPGDAFVVPGGFEGEWCNLTRVSKHYVIMNLKDPTP
jgi:hypothetical protein